MAKLMPLESAINCKSAFPETAFPASEPIIDPPNMLPKSRNDKEIIFANFPIASRGKEIIPKTILEKRRSGKELNLRRANGC